MPGDAGRSILRILGAVSGRLLGIAGVISAGCYQAAEPTYGVPSLNITLTGTVRSSADSSSIEGIYLRVFSPMGSVFTGDETLTDQNGAYHIEVEDYGFYDTDSIGIIADDIDGELNGLFLSSDTVAAVLQTGEQVISTDVILDPEDR